MSRPAKAQISNTSRPGPTYDFFLSYTGKDRSEVKAVYDELAKAGHSAFIDVEQIRAGQVISDAVSTAISQSKVMVFFLSKASVEAKEGEWMIAEHGESKNTHYCIYVWLDIEMAVVLESSYWRHTVGTLGLTREDPEFFDRLTRSLLESPPRSNVNVSRSVRAIIVEDELGDALGDAQKSLSEIKSKLEDRELEKKFWELLKQLDAGRYFGWYREKSEFLQKLYPPDPKPQNPVVISYSYSEREVSLADGLKSRLASRFRAPIENFHPHTIDFSHQDVLTDTVRELRDRLVGSNGSDLTMDTKVVVDTEGPPCVLFLDREAGKMNAKHLQAFVDEFAKLQSRPRLLVIIRIPKKSIWTSLLHRFFPPTKASLLGNLVELKPLTNSEPQIENFTKHLGDEWTKEPFVSVGESEKFQTLKAGLQTRLREVCQEIFADCVENISMRAWREKFKQKLQIIADESNNEIKHLREERKRLLEELKAWGNG